MKDDKKKRSSNYARKKAWLEKSKYHWGFEVPEPKPWKKIKKD